MPAADRSLTLIRVGTRLGLLSYAFVAALGFCAVAIEATGVDGEAWVAPLLIGVFVASLAAGVVGSAALVTAAVAGETELRRSAARRIPFAALIPVIVATGSILLALFPPDFSFM